MKKILVWRIRGQVGGKNQEGVNGRRINMIEIHNRIVSKTNKTLSQLHTLKSKIVHVFCFSDLHVAVCKMLVIY